MFPNLKVIRGEKLIGHYSLIFYDMSTITEVSVRPALIAIINNNLQNFISNCFIFQIGLPSLIKIQQGYVIVSLCPVLCYFDTVMTINGNIFSI